MTASGPEPGAPDAADEIEALRERVRLLEAAAVAAAEHARGDAQLIRSLRMRVGLLEGSTSFRLGHALVLGAQSPARLARLPKTAWRLWRDSRHGQPSAGAAAGAAMGAAKPPRPVASDALALLAAIPRRASPAVEPVAGRLAYVLHNSLPWSSGGYATRAQGLAAGMRAAGLDVVGVTRPGFPLDLRPELTAEDLSLRDSIEGIDYHRILFPQRTDIPAADYMRAAADALEDKLRQLRPEWVMAASNHVTALPALLAARRLGLPFLYEVRGFWEVTRLSREPEFERRAAFRIQRQLEAGVARAADHVLTLTGPMQEELVRRGVDARKITLLPNSCDPARFTPRPRDPVLAARLGIPASVPVIGYIGTFVQYEGLEDLVAACALLFARGRDFRLLLVGNENASGTGTGPITAEIGRLAAATGLGDRLLMPGRVPHEEVEAYYSLLDIAPFPRKPQPVTEMVSPMKPLEALAMEKAVVVSSVAALTEMIADERTGLVFAKGEVASLADALDRLIGDPGLCARLGRDGRDWVVRERTWSEMGRRARATLEALTAETGAGTGAGTPARVPA